MRDSGVSLKYNDQYDILHFEALGPEATHLEEETAAAIEAKMLPQDHKYLVTPASVQDFLKENPGFSLPRLLTTKTHSVIPDSYVAEGGKGIVTRSAGYDHFEHLVGKIHVTSLREYCVNAVAQTATKFFYATAGRMNHYAANTTNFDRQSCQAFLELAPELTLTVFGMGKIGKRIYDLAVANGLTAQGVDLREKELKTIYGDSVRFVSKDEAIGSTDIIVNAMNLNKDAENSFYNVDYFSKEYLSRALKKLIFINVTRGEIAPESGLLELYQAGSIIGIGLDVFSKEAQFTKVLHGDETTDSDLLAAQVLISMSLQRTANIYVQPHQAFNSNIAARTKASETMKRVISWYENGGRCFDEELPYY